MPAPGAGTRRAPEAIATDALAEPRVIRSLPVHRKARRMQNVTCPACQAGFEVDFSPGTEFTCGGCGGTVVVPAAPAPAPRPAPRGAAPRPAAAAPRPAPARQPAARAARAPAAAAPPRKPPTMMWLGIGGGVVAIGVIAFFLTRGGSDEGQAQKSPPPVVVTPPPKVETEPVKTRPTEPLEAARFDAARPGAGATDHLALADLLWTRADEAEAAGKADQAKSLRDQAQKSYGDVLRLEKGQVRARERLGYVKLDLAEAERYSKAEFLPRKLRQDIGDIIDQLKTAAGGKALSSPLWLNPKSETQAELANDWRRCLKEATRRETVEKEKSTDPFYSRADNMVAAIESDVGESLRRKGVTGNTFVGFPYKPYVIVVQRDPNWEPDVIAAKWAETLEQLRETFLERFGAKFNLKVMDRPTPVMVLRYDTDYARYLRRGDSRATISSAAHFEPFSKRLVTWADVDNTDSASKHGISEDEVRTTLFHEGTHQLMDFYTTQRMTNLDESLWFSEGIADYFGGHGRKWDASLGRWRYEPGLINEERVKQLAEAKSGGYLFKLEDLLAYKRSHYERDKGMPNDPRPLTAYAQGWGLVYYTANWHDGKLRDKFEQYVKTEMDGRSGKEAFTAIFGTDLAAVEKDFLEMIDVLAKAQKDKKIVNGKIVQ